MRSRFHEEALRHLSLPYEQDEEAMRSLSARAQTLGIELPASFAEWYGMRAGPDLLREKSNCDDPVAIDRLGEQCTWRWNRARNLVAEGLLVFMVENQAVCIWAVKLNAGDDPPVLVARDPDLEWHPCADRFSSFVASQIWDHTEVFDETGHQILIQAQEPALTLRDLAFLRERSHELPGTHGWPGNHQYRFEGGDARLLIWDSDDQADWYLSAASSEGLTTLLRELFERGDLAGFMWSNDERGETILRQVRRR